jgi:hypothetical protein
VQAESQERIRHLPQPPLEQRRKLNRVLLGQVHRRRILVERIRDLLQPPDVSVLSEDTLDRHVCASAHRLAKEAASLPICRMVDTMSSMNSGTRKQSFVEPNWESDPVRSTRISIGTPNTPSRQLLNP